MQLTSLGVTWSARGLPSAAAHAPPPFTLAGDARSVRQPDAEQCGLLDEIEHKRTAKRDCLVGPCGRGTH